MPIATQCLEPGCKTMTIGPRCIEHDLVLVPRVFTRGRPVDAYPDPLRREPVHAEPEPVPGAGSAVEADRLVAA